MRMGLFKIWSLFLIANGLAFAKAEYYCADFTNGWDGWTNTGLRAWQWSGAASPDTSDIPNFLTDGYYVWFQDQTSPPNTGTIISQTITIYPNDAIKASIFRHIQVYDGTDRPLISLTTNGGSHKQPILWSWNTDNWDTLELRCGPGDEPCCLTYPCTGYFQIDGAILGYDELLAVDQLEVNGGCSVGPPPPPPPPPTPGPVACCNFDTVELCYWSLATESTGWHWSSDIQPDWTTHPSFYRPTPYIWVQDESSTVTSNLFYGVAPGTVFQLEYYYYSDSPSNNAVFYFTSGSYREVLGSVYTSSGGWRSTTLVAGAGVCGGASSCNGYFEIDSYDARDTSELVAIDNFQVNYGC